MKHIGRIFDKVSGHLFKKNKDARDNNPEIKSLSDEFLNEGIVDNKKGEEDAAASFSDHKAKILKKKKIYESWSDDESYGPFAKRDLTFLEEEEERLRLEEKEREKFKQALRDAERHQYKLFMKALQADKELDEKSRKEKEMKFLRDAEKKRKDEFFKKMFGKIKARKGQEKENEKHNPGQGLER